MSSGNGLTRAVKRATAGLLHAGGYQVQRVDRMPRTQFKEAARPYTERHDAQTLATVQTLRERYREPVFGMVSVWSMVELLSHVVDRMDHELMNVTQEIHVLLMLEGMLAEGVDDESILLTAILHDLGKVLYLVDEDPANISGSNAPIGEYEDGQGFDQCVFQWNHDEFGYSRFAGRVPDHVGWLIRYHSVIPGTCLHLMDDRDRDYYERYWKEFRRWERDTKSIHHVPRTRIADYRQLVDAAFPDPILF
jgi:hypothetical protein